MTMDYFAMPPDAIVEPWTPQVGDRVRVRLSGECQVVRPDISKRWGYLGDVIGHEAAEHLRTGSVSPEPGWDADGRVGNVTHPICVRFDEPFSNPRSGGRVVGAYYAAIELEPLDEAS